MMCEVYTIESKVEQNRRWWHKESYLNWKIFASVDDDVSHYQFCTLNHNKNSWGSERKEKMMEEEAKQKTYYEGSKIYIKKHRISLDFKFEKIKEHLQKLFLLYIHTYRVLRKSCYSYIVISRVNIIQHRYYFYYHRA